jgi:hypothetical protein
MQDKNNERRSFGIVSFASPTDDHLSFTPGFRSRLDYGLLLQLVSINIGSLRDFFRQRQGNLELYTAVTF